MQCANVAINIAMTLLTQVLSDRVGRKPLMMAGACIQCAALMTMGGLGTVPDPSKAIMSGVTAVFIIFGAGFSLGWAPLSHVVAAEIPTNRLRDPTYAFGAVFNIIIQFAISFSIPYLLYAPYANLGSKVVRPVQPCSHSRTSTDFWSHRDSSLAPRLSAASSSRTSASPSAAARHSKKSTSSSSKACQFGNFDTLKRICLLPMLERRAAWRKRCMSRRNPMSRRIHDGKESKQVRSAKARNVK